MDLGLAGKVAIVTGGASGIGEATVRAFLDEGAKVAIIDKDVARGNSLWKQLFSKGPVEFYGGDLSSDRFCKEAVDGIGSHFGSIDVLVNNAGRNDTLGLNRSPQEFRKSLDQNLVHYFTMAHFALPYLMASKGSIVNVSSKVGVRGEGGTSAYAAAKGGILGMTVDWAIDLARYGIRVNAITPASVQTPLHDQWVAANPDGAAAVAETCKRIYLGNRLTQPREIANAILFLSSPTMASHITGEVISSDGGNRLDRCGELPDYTKQ